MYLTRVAFNKEKSGARKLIAYPQNLHAAVMKSFSNEAIDNFSQGRILYRLELEHRDPFLYILSPEIPDLGHLLEQAGRPNDKHGVITKNYSSVLDSIKKGQKLRFKVSVNPVYRDAKTRKYVPHVTHSQINSWFVEKAGKHGFEVTSSDVTKVFETRVKKGNQQVGIKGADIEGVIEITDETIMKQTLTHGIGRGRGYGFGLLTIGKM